MTSAASVATAYAAAALGPGEALPVEVLEHVEQRLPEAVDVDEHDGLVVEAEEPAGDLLEQLLERAEAARQGHEGVGAAGHLGLPA